VTYGEVRRTDEVQQSVYSFREADVAFFREMFERWEREAGRLLSAERSGDGAPAPLTRPAYEAVLKCSHLFNVLDARGALSVTERAAFIQRIRRMACRCAEAWLAERATAR
jgi:glycyl-tRNA synthetase alpha chain